jgi:hypothetical protein
LVPRADWFCIVKRIKTKLKKPYIAGGTKMKCNKWTLALAAAGVVSVGSVVQAEEAAPHQVLTALSSTTLSGYVDTSAIWKPGTDQGGGRLPGHVFDGPDKMDGFNLHAVKLTLEKPLDEGQWSAGYKADLVFGPDANYYATTLNGGGTTIANNLAIKQAYVALRAPVGNGIDFKIGVFDTIIGYEVFESGNNPNFSRSYGYALEPTHHTGILASYKINDWLSVAGGVADTAYGAVNERSAIGIESTKAYMGSVTISLPDKAGPMGGSVIYLGVVNGFNGAAFGGSATPGTSGSEKVSNYYAGATFKTPLTGLSVGAAFDYRTDAPGITVENRAYSVGGYLSYAFTEKLHLNDRIEYLNADAGTFYSPAAPGSQPNTREKFLSNTLTLDYSLWDNVLTRAEFRWDHSLDGDRPFGGNLNPQKNAVMLAANIIYKF